MIQLSMNKLNFSQTVIKNIEDYENSESFLFLRGYKRESRIVRDSVQSLAESLAVWQTSEGLAKIVIEQQALQIMVATTEFIGSVLQIEVSRHL